MFKKISLSLLGLIAFCAIVFGFGMADLEWFKFFAPRKENIRREVFENTKSYTHGKIQDLAKYYDEYRKIEDITEKSAVESVVKMQFSNFDASVIYNQQLKSFLISIRGY